MFTGIITGRGVVLGLEKPAAAAGLAVLRLDAGELAADITVGASIAVDGVCLTVAGLPLPGRGELVLEVMGETLGRSTMSGLRPGDQVNLERCTQVGERLDGHIVQGHVDGVGRILAIEQLPGWRRVRCSVPLRLSRHLAEKGSVAVDGVSLTLTAVSEIGSQNPWFEVGLIPATVAATGLGVKGLGEAVNVETDVLAKYAERLLGFARSDDRIGTSKERR